MMIHVVTVIAVPNASSAAGLTSELLLTPLFPLTGETARGIYVLSSKGKELCGMMKREEVITLSAWLPA